MITLITDRKLIGEGFLTRVAYLVTNQMIDQIILREKDLSHKDLYALYLEIKKRICATDIKLVVNASLAFGKKYNIDTLHFSQKNFKGLKKPPKNLKFGVSVHNLTEAKMALVKNPEYLLLSPVFESSCKPNADALTLKKINGIKKISNVPLILLGGINPKRIKSLEKKGYDKFAMRSYLLQNNVIDICL